MSKPLETKTKQTVGELIGRLLEFPEDSLVEFVFNFGGWTDHGDCMKPCGAKMLGSCKECQAFYLKHVKLEIKLDKTKASKTPNQN